MARADKRVRKRNPSWTERDGRRFHSPRVMRSSPPGGMNELWKEATADQRRRTRGEDKGKRGGMIEMRRKRKRRSKMNLPAGYWKYLRAVQHGAI